MKTIQCGYAEYRRRFSVITDALNKQVRTGDIGVFPLSHLNNLSDKRAKDFRRVKGDPITEEREFSDIICEVSEKEAKVQEKEIRPLRIGLLEHLNLRDTLRTIRKCEDPDQIEEWRRDEPRPAPRKFMKYRLDELRMQASFDR